MRRACGVLLVSCLLLPACGGGGGGGGSPTTPQATPPPAPVTTNIYRNQFTAPADSFGVQDISVPSAGQVQVFFDWTNASSDIDIVVTPTSCGDFLSAYLGACTVYGEDKRLPPGTRATVTFSLTAAGTIRFWGFNFATANESGVLSVNLTR